MKPLRLHVVVAVLIAGWFSVAAADNVPPDHAAKMARGLDLFKKHVRPVLADRCLKCHGGKETEAGFDLSDRAPLLKGGDSGPAVLTDRAKDSLLVKLLRHEKEPKMPKGLPRLGDDVVAQIVAWIDAGAPYDKPLIEKADPKAWIKKEIAPDAKKHWAFQPLRRVEPPNVKDGGAISPIDRFLRAKQEQAGIAPNGPAERRVLIRRAYFDLIGLPPAPAEVETFVNDKAPGGWERVIDHLLKSRHYGERWGRHWLDLARFGESHGFEHDYDRPSAYHYRDFVIKALNDDLPYDTFIKWQLAGDEYAPEKPLAWMATGYLAAGVHSTQITKNEVERHRYDEMDDMLATTGTAMLGLTIGCARCHDHKYDAFPQADYYRMLATFTSTIRSEHEIDLDPEGYKKALAAFQKVHEPLVWERDRFEKEQLPARFAMWEKSKKAVPPSWIIPEVKQQRSAGGATVTKQDDGSALVSGTNPPIETLIFTYSTDLRDIKSIRLEALSHPSLVKNGPGRAANGNFALTDLKVAVSRRTSAGKPGDKPPPSEQVKLKNPRATFEQKGLPASAAIDADPVTSGWAIDPQFGKDHAAVFEFDSPVGFDGGTVIGVTMTFSNNVGHGLGRPRVSFATSADLPLAGPAMAESFKQALELAAEKRTPVQRELLLKWYRTLDSQWKALDQKVQDHAKVTPKPNKVKALVSGEGLPAVRLHTQGEDLLPDTHFLRRGDVEQKDAVAPMGFMQVLMPAANSEKSWQRPVPAGSKSSFRRTAMAEWMTDTQKGAGAILARVIVNRLWQHHLGRGIVATPSDFGVRGEPPTHPELLDYLAGELIAGGWKLKAMHKLIMNSAAYMQSSDADETRLKADRENKLVWRRPPQRLESEVIRDTLLSLGGALDTTMYGPGTLDESSKRRSIYFTVKRSKLIGMMVVFDAPEALTGVAERPATTIAPQALMLMNNPQVRSWAKGFAQRVAAKDEAASVRAAYAFALSRPPSAEELADALAFLQSQTELYTKAGKSDASQLALADFCQAVMCLNEVVYID